MSSLPIGTYNNDPVLVTPVSGVQSVWFVFVMSGFEQCLSILLCEFHLCTVVLTQLRGVVSVHLLTGRHDVSTVLTLDFLVPSFINNELPVVEEGFAAAKAFPRIGTRMLVLEVLMEGRLNGSTCLTNLTVPTGFCQVVTVGAHITGHALVATGPWGRRKIRVLILIALLGRVHKCRTPKSLLLPPCWKS